MKHLGDITKINGAEVPRVCVMIGGSPCQDLSIAGQRAGLGGARSGLFMEQIRIIKEMRKKDIESGRTGEDVFPRFMLWENVPGAFSSNGGEDFRAVLEETARIADENAVIPRPAKGKWTPAGGIVGDGWSIAWRVFDAQFWGVPQRRKRIALVADFGNCGGAFQILFEREGVSGDSEESGTERERTASDAERCALADDRSGIPYTLKIRSGCEGGGKGALVQTDKSATLGCNNDQYLFQPYAFSFDSLASNSMKSANPHSGCREVDVAKTLDTSYPDPAKNQGGIAIVEPLILDDQGGSQINVCKGDVVPTLRVETHGHPPLICFEPGIAKRDGSENRFTEGVSSTLRSNMGDNQLAVAYAIGNGQADQTGLHEKAGTLNCMHDQQAVLTVETGNTVYDISHRQDAVREYADSAPTLDARMGTGGGNVPVVLESYGIGRDAFNSGENAKFGMSIEEDVQPPLVAKGPGAVMAVETDNRIIYRYIVRRLTPLECERLQGYPDGWTDIGDWTDGKGKVHKCSDAARYKALGNSIALPQWRWILGRMSELCVERTMASLFDGIGGFPLIWEELNGIGSCVWASEIEEFPMAVTRMRFGEA